MDVNVTFHPLQRQVKVKSGTTVLQASRKAGIAIVTRCGGNASCFMCKVTIEDDSGLAPMNDKEKRKLAGLEQSNIRLACQAVLQRGAVDIILPPDRLREAIAKQLAKQREQDTLW